MPDKYMPETIHLEQDADGVFKVKEAQFLGDYPEQHQVVTALASGAVLLVNPADISGDEKAQKATELVINAAFDFAALFIPLPPGTVDFVKNQLIPYYSG